MLFRSGQVNLLISLTSQSIWMNLKYIRRYIRIKSMGNFWLKKRGCLKLMNFSCRILIMPGLPVIKDRQRWQTADLFQRALLARRGRSMSIRNIRGNLPMCSHLLMHLYLLRCLHLLMHSYLLRYLRWLMHLYLPMYLHLLTR